MESEDMLIRYRAIVFCDLHPDPHQAQTAMLLLSDIEGMEHLSLTDDGVLHVGYDLHHLSLEIIEAALIEVGFHLHNSLMHNLKRALYYYTEETQRANMGLGKACSNCTQIFINRYQRLRHGCRDQRSRHWRKYL